MNHVMLNSMNASNDYICKWPDQLIRASYSLVEALHDILQLLLWKDLDLPVFRRGSTEGTPLVGRSLAAKIEFFLRC